MGLELNFTLTLSVIRPENLLGNWYMVRWNIHSFKVTHLGIIYDIIHLHHYFTVPMKSGLGKYCNTTIQPEVWLLVVSCST